MILALGDHHTLKRVHPDVYHYRDAYILCERDARGRAKSWQVNIQGVANNRRTRAECMKVIDLHRSLEAFK